MGLIIAEIGGSSSRWALLQGGRAAIVPLAGDALPGFNPWSGDPERFLEGVRGYLGQHLPGALDAGIVVAYAAGCGTPERAAVMEAVLRSIWLPAAIEVHSDLQGAARGLWGHEAGLVLVLGTGSSVGWHDGAQLHQHFPSLGYVLGDEGSGADIGRALLQDAFYRRMPADLRERLFGPGGPFLGEVLEQVYRSPFPSKALADYAGLLAGCQEEPYVRELITGRFHAFIEAFKPFHAPEDRARVRATGSVAWGFQELLADCLADHGMELMGVERDPLARLVRWHRPGPE